MAEKLNYLKRAKKMLWENYKLIAAEKRLQNIINMTSEFYFAKRKRQHRIKAFAMQIYAHIQQRRRGKFIYSISIHSYAFHEIIS